MKIERFLIFIAEGTYEVQRETCEGKIWTEVRCPGGEMPQGWLHGIPQDDFMDYLRTMAETWYELKLTNVETV